ncbi:MAG TPA: serine protease [Spirochaetia bacterium]|nr:serine protease [Spirochaetia bacterium]
MLRRNRNGSLLLGRLFFAAALVLSVWPVVAQEDLKNYVPLIRTNFHQETRATFEALATHFAEGGHKQLADFFAAYAKAGGFGTGWVYVAEDGENFIITNRHVVSESASVDISFEQADGSYKTYSNAPIVYVDDSADLAIVQFPGGARVFKRGFPIDTTLRHDGTELFSAGFPAFGGEPLWQFSTGIVTNSRARPAGFAGYDYLIQHSSQIDKGNSGGPLMVRDSRSATGFAVIGVNTWKATQRENTNFSIPALVLMGTIDRARKAMSVRNSVASMGGKLEEDCRVLASELQSPNPDLETIHQYISYALVGRRGWEAFQTILATVKDQTSWEESFFQDPIETMRTSLYYLFWLTLGKREGGGSVEFSGISAADRSRIGTATGIRTGFRVGASTTEISWTWEYGRWRVLDFEVPPVEIAPPSTPSKEVRGSLSPFSLILLGGHVTAGTSNGYGNIYSQQWFPSAGAGSADKGVFGWSVGISAEANLVRDVVWLETQLNLVNKGRYYEWNYPADTVATNNVWVQEQILYLQVPAMAKVMLVIDDGLSMTIAGGPALNIAVAPGGVYWDYNNKQYALPSTWYSGSYLKPVALSVVGEAAVYFGLGGSKLGIFGKVDYDLTADFDYGGPDSSNFATFTGGLRLVFPLYARVSRQ